MKDNAKDNKGESKSQILASTLKSIERKFGAGSLMLMNKNNTQNIEAISTGSLSLDIAIGIGGLPKGRIIEIYGPESSGKTTFALSAVAECQKAGGTAVYIDAEHALDVSYAKKIGVNIDSLYISQPDYGEQALEIADELVSSGGVDMIVIDSVAALIPKDELEGSMDKANMGMHARLMSKALRKLASLCNKSGCIIVFINQIRMKIGVMFGSPETTTGGQALKYFASVRLDIRKVKNIMNKDNVIGSETKIKVVKNKVSPPFKTALVDILYGVGFDILSEIVILAETLGIVTRSGAWYSYKGERIAQGKENFKSLLKTDKKLAEELEKLVREKAAQASDIEIMASAADEDVEDPFRDEEVPLE